MARVDGKTVLVTGAARGQGRAHAVRLAEEGANVVAVDICADIDSIGYAMATREDLDLTAELATAAGAEVMAACADVRDGQAVCDVVNAALARFDRIDAVVSNAGVVSYASLWEIDPVQWSDVIATNLTGHWNVMRAVVPSMLGRGGAIVLIGSAVSTKPISHAAHYVASKHGLVGLMKAAALELAPQRIRVNMINPGGVATAMVDNEMTHRLFCPGIADPTMDDMAEVAAHIHPMGVSFLEPSDISHAVVYLVSEESRYVSGAMLAVDLGMAVN
jgi:SDR family mycofactocin-dependent oxidoreductase